jgi:hypothetical protein
MPRTAAFQAPTVSNTLSLKYPYRLNTIPFSYFSKGTRYISPFLNILFIFTLTNSPLPRNPLPLHIQLQNLHHAPNIHLRLLLNH